MALDLGALIDQLTIENLRQCHVQKEPEGPERGAALEKVAERIHHLHAEIDRLVQLPVEQRSSPETLGALVDRLSIENIRLWMLEDESRMYEKGDEHVAGITRKIHAANKRRNELIAEIDRFAGASLGEVVKIYHRGR